MITIPTKIISGDTFKIKDITLEDYPADTWTLTMSLQGSSAISITATADGTDYQILETAANTSTYTEGTYNYVLFVSDTATGLEQYTVQSGQVEIEKRADLSGIGDKRSHYQIVLENLNAVIEKRATRDQSSYSIGGRTISRMTIDELLSLRTYYTQRLNETKGKSRPRIKRNWLR